MYSKYYEQHNAGRNDLLANAEVAFQTFAFDHANIRALRAMDLDRDKARVLDVGCGSGAGLIQFLRLGFLPDQLAGIDISQERIDVAQRTLPSVEFKCESADALSYADAAFDIVFESTMFVLLPSEEIARAIAREMVRVTRPGGYLMLVDWRYSKPGTDVYRAMNRSRISELFEVGSRTTIVTRQRGALVPPLGRFFSRRMPSLYFLAQAMLPFAVGQVTTVLRKN